MADVDTERLEQLTIEIRVLKETADRDAAETVVEVGERLEQAYAMLGRGSWSSWLEEQISLSDQSARNYRRTAAWAARHAELFAQWKDLGPNKLYAISKLEGRPLTELKRRKTHAIPGSQHRRTLAAMSGAQVHAVVNGLRGERPLARPIGRVIGSARQRARLLAQTATEMVARADEVDPEAAAEVHTTLAEAMETLESAFDFG